MFIVLIVASAALPFLFQNQQHAYWLQASYDGFLQPLLHIQDIETAAWLFRTPQ